MIGLIVTIIIIILVVSLLFWAIGELPIPEPIGKYAKIVIIVFACLYLISLLLPWAQGTALR